MTSFATEVEQPRLSVTTESFRPAGNLSYYSKGGRESYVCKPQRALSRESSKIRRESGSVLIARPTGGLPSSHTYVRLGTTNPSVKSFQPHLIWAIGRSSSRRKPEATCFNTPEILGRDGYPDDGTACKRKLCDHVRS